MAEEKQEELHFRDELFEELMYGKQEKSSKTKRNTQVLELPRDISTMNVASIPQNYTIRMERIAEQMFSTNAARSWIYCKLSPYFKKEEQTLREAEKLTNDAKKVQIKIYGLTERLQDVKKRKGVKILSYLNVFTSAINLVASGYKLFKALKEGVSSALYPQISFAGNLQLFIMSSEQRRIMLGVIKIQTATQFNNFVQSLADAVLAPYLPVILNMCEEIFWYTVDVILAIIQSIPKIGKFFKKAAGYALKGLKTVSTATKSARVIEVATKVSNIATKTVKGTNKFFTLTRTGRVIAQIPEKAKSIRNFMYGTVSVNGKKIPTRTIFRIFHDSNACLGAFQNAGEVLSNAVQSLENVFHKSNASDGEVGNVTLETEQINNEITKQTTTDISERLASHDYSPSLSLNKDNRLSLGSNIAEKTQNYENLTLTVIHETLTTIMNSVSIAISDTILNETKIGNFLAAAKDAVNAATGEKPNARQEAEDVMDQYGETEKARFIRYTFRTTENEVSARTKKFQRLQTESYSIQIFNAKDKTIKNKVLKGAERFLPGSGGIGKMFVASNSEEMQQIAFEFGSFEKNTYRYSQKNAVVSTSGEIIRVAAAIIDMIDRNENIKLDETT